MIVISLACLLNCFFDVKTTMFSFLSKLNYYFFISFKTSCRHSETEKYFISTEIEILTGGGRNERFKFKFDFVVNLWSNLESTFESHKNLLGFDYLFIELFLRFFQVKEFAKRCFDSNPSNKNWKSNIDKANSLFSFFCSEYFKDEPTNNLASKQTQLSCLLTNIKNVRKKN